MGQGWHCISAYRHPLTTIEDARAALSAWLAPLAPVVDGCSRGCLADVVDALLIRHPGSCLL